MITVREIDPADTPVDLVADLALDVRRGQRVTARGKRVLVVVQHPYVVLQRLDRVHEGRHRTVALANQLVRHAVGIDLNAELVVLSACETGRGKEVLGEGLMGMTRAFLYAGTPSVVVSLWRVADAQTPDLMLRIYEDLDRMGDKAEALRQAKLAMIRRGGPIAQPYYWAPFILVGKR